MWAVTGHVARATADETQVVLGAALVLFRCEFPILAQLASQVRGMLSSGGAGSGSGGGGMRLGLLRARAWGGGLGCGGAGTRTVGGGVTGGLLGLVPGVTIDFSPALPVPGIDGQN